MVPVVCVLKVLSGGDPHPTSSYPHLLAMHRERARAVSHDHPDGHDTLRDQEDVCPDDVLDADQRAQAPPPQVGRHADEVDYAARADPPRRRRALCVLGLEHMPPPGREQVEWFRGETRSSGARKAASRDSNIPDAPPAAKLGGGGSFREATQPAGTVPEKENSDGLWLDSLERKPFRRHVEAREMPFATEKVTIRVEILMVGTVQQAASAIYRL